MPANPLIQFSHEIIPIYAETFRRFESGRFDLKITMLYNYTLAFKYIRVEAFILKYARLKNDFCQYILPFYNKRYSIAFYEYLVDFHTRFIHFFEPVSRYTQ